MSKNVGMIDRSLRILAAIILVVLTYTGEIAGNWALAAWGIAAILAVTSLVSFCPIYRLIGLSTCQAR